MALNYMVLLSGFASGLFIGTVASLINTMLSVFARWTMDG